MLLAVDEIFTTTIESSSAVLHKGAVYLFACLFVLKQNLEYM